MSHVIGPEAAILFLSPGLITSTHTRNMTSNMVSETAKTSISYDSVFAVIVSKFTLEPCLIVFPQMALFCSDKFVDCSVIQRGTYQLKNQVFLI